MSETLFQRLGGAPAIKAATDIFYQKVLADDRINHFFSDVNMKKQAAKQRAFLTFAFGGPNHYNGKDMAEAHAHLVAKGLTDSHFDAVVENLGATLVDLGVQTEMIQEAAAVAESVRNDILGRTESLLHYWKKWNKVSSCDKCNQHAILKDSNGSVRAMIAHSDDCVNA